MLSPQLRRKIFDLWTKLWSSGMTNPLTSIEQITYLLFIKQMEKVDEKRQEKGKGSIYGKRLNCTLPHIENDKKDSPETTTFAKGEFCIGHNSCRWSYITDIKEYRDPNHLSQYVFPWLRELETILKETGNEDDGLKKPSRYMEDAYFQFPQDKKDTLDKTITTINELFQNVGEHTTSDDMMGDIFEYLLNEIQTSGKNGQFRTPRHIIRFIIALLDPKPGQCILDPASGTCGFLTNTVQYILQKNTSPEKLRLEWDGTAYHADGDMLVQEKRDLLFDGKYFSGYDNDRTMVRIGWMNMILHGIDKPIIELQDALGKGSEKFPAINANTYDIVVANPPYSGTVDKGDLHQTRFPCNSKDVLVTNKSELLFVWLMLDALVDGGRAAVIVPEGLLFNSSGAHIELRRQLLFDHRLEAVISLPAGVFQPYTGVKTSILIFEKNGDKLVSGEQPRTEKVWFYEVAADGFTLDAKRSEKPEPNDLWDALAKWPSKNVDKTYYYQPKFYDQRWRLVDEDTIKTFPSLTNKQNQVRSIHELFTDLPENPDEATKQIIEAQKPKIMELYHQGKTVNSLFTSAMAEMLEKDDKDLPAFARRAILPLLKKASKVVDNPNNKAPQLTDEQIQIEVKAIVQEFAKLDGYNIKLRTVDVLGQENILKESKSWFAYVREFKDPEQATNKELYNENGTIKSDYLDDKCIEANDFNLSAGRYKPFTLTKVDHEPPAKIIRELQALETRIQDGLSKLLAMVEDEE